MAELLYAAEAANQHPHAYFYNRGLHSNLESLPMNLYSWWRL